MSQANQDQQRLAKAIRRYCTQCRSVSHNGKKQDTSPELQALFKELLPTITIQIDDGLSSESYVQKVVEYGVAGIDNSDRIVTVIWEEYFLGRATYEYVENKTHYKAISRRADSFPNRVAQQLLMKNRELTEPQKVLPSPKTTQQRHHEIVFSQDFGLTNRETEVILTYVRLGNHRKAVARELNISPETLKLHRRSILKKMKYSTIPEAIEKVRAIIWAGETDG